MIRNLLAARASRNRSHTRTSFRFYCPPHVQRAHFLPRPPIRFMVGRTLGLLNLLITQRRQITVFGSATHRDVLCPCAITFCSLANPNLSTRFELSVGEQSDFARLIVPDPLGRNSSLIEISGAGGSSALSLVSSSRGIVIGADPAGANAAAGRLLPPLVIARAISRTVDLPLVRAARHR